MNNNHAAFWSDPCYTSSSEEEIEENLNSIIWDATLGLVTAGFTCVFRPNIPIVFDTLVICVIKPNTPIVFDQCY